MMGFGFLWMGLLFVGVPLLLGGGALWLFRQAPTGRLAGAREPAARQILNERLARGEIGAADYEAIRAKLEQ